MSTVIHVENVAKQYRLGEVGTGTLSHDVNRWWHKVRGREDPYLMIGESNDRTKKGASEYSWALRDVSFEVKQGEVLGIIGRNGAGKSTLLKILSRVTTPSTGKIKVKGRIASLLEVGTGFHPELTGRENIFLNGAILGMRKAEIAAKFDEIVEFSGCERYIDTPVKRYSSGMYVRLAFAVAAHLEPEILIIDEVLAVGDADFQKKCLGKMKDVAAEGRTVLFVSHNMASVVSLCSTALILDQGKIDFSGSVENAVSQYLGKSTDGQPAIASCRPASYLESSQDVCFTKVELRKGQPRLGFGTQIDLQIELMSKIEIQDLTLAGSIYDKMESPIGTFFSTVPVSVVPGRPCRVSLCLEGIKLAPGHYTFGFGIGQGSHRTKRRDFDVVIGMPRFEIAEVGGEEVVGMWHSNWGSLNLSDYCRVNVLSSGPTCSI
jgi:lipopolysaccharide transport system ATP-binding protein